MALCITVGSLTTRLLVSAFTLAWTHSVEHTGWQEDWQVAGDRLVLLESRVKGSGAGMEPGDDAVLRDGWWRSHPPRRLSELRLANSGAAGVWQLCAPDCRALEAAAPTPIILAPCHDG
ncbi:MAG: DUF1850 domain-containing protein [Geminicoccaceae bacterium]